MSGKFKFWSSFVVSLIVVIVLIAGMSMPAGSAHAATGFTVSGGNLLDANGNNFIMRGISHPHIWYPSQTSSFANIKATGANTVRVVLGGGRWGPNSASDVANVIDLCKTNKLICLLENHDTTGYGEQGGATSLAQAVTYWQSIQSVLTGQESYVIINIGNEPYGNNNTSGWIADTRNAIIAMRNAGFDHTLMVDAPNWGQDWQFIMRDNAASLFNSDPDRNTVFSIHMYGVFDTAAEVQSYLSSFITAGLPLVIGEFGIDHSDGNPDEDAIMSQAQANGIGYIGWSWSGNSGGVEYLDMVTNFNPSQRTTWGTRIITGANGIQQTSQEASVYGGSNPTNTPGGPTATRTNTPFIPTATRTNTPTTGGALKVQLMGSGTDNNQQSSFRFRVQNTGSSAQSNISVRVYFTTDGSQAASSYVLEKYWDQSGIAAISGPTQASGSTYYFTVSYGSTSLAAGASWEFHTGMHLNNWSTNFSSSNDWWRSTGTLPASYTDWTNVPAYVSGSRIWGGEPGGPNPTATNTSVPPTATRTNTPVGPTATRTNTPVGPTATRTSTPIPNTPTFTPIVVTNTPTTGTTTLKIQYRAADTNVGDNQIKPHFNIVNGGVSSVPLSELKIRYWFTREGAASQNFWCDWAAIPGSCTNVTGTFVQTAGANFYLEVGFTSAAGSVTAGGQSGEIQTRFAKADWSNYIETDDYSFDPTKTSFADWTRVTLYRNGVLVWGIEP